MLLDCQTGYQMQREGTSFKAFAQPAPGSMWTERGLRRGRTADMGGW